MNFSAGILPVWIHWIAVGIFLGIFGLAVYLAPWKRFRADPQRVHVFLGACVALLVLWQMQAGLRPGLSFHLLGGTLFLLMFGWTLAFIGVTLVTFGSTINGMGDFFSLPLNVLIMAGVPIGVSWALLRISVRFLPHNFFVYVLGNAFFSGALSMAAALALTTALLAGFSPYPMEKVAGHLVFAPLMIFAEAFFSGMVATSLVLFRPDWVCTFDDRRYLSGK